jgi:ATP synthase protein I
MEEEKEIQQEHEKQFMEKVGRKVRRKIRKRKEGKSSFWFGLGMFGLVGWSVVIPTILGVALGVWIDKITETPYSWTLILLFGGVMLGTFNAWYWIKRKLRGED